MLAAEFDKLDHFKFLIDKGVSINSGMVVKCHKSFKSETKGGPLSNPIDFFETFSPYQEWNVNYCPIDFAGPSVRNYILYDHFFNPNSKMKELKIDDYFESIKNQSVNNILSIKNKSQKQLLLLLKFKSYIDQRKNGKPYKGLSNLVARSSWMTKQVKKTGFMQFDRDIKTTAAENLFKLALKGNPIEDIYPIENNIPLDENTKDKISLAAKQGEVGKFFNAFVAVDLITLENTQNMKFCK